MFSSQGLKRTIAGYLATISAVIRSIPGLEGLSVGLDSLVGLLGGVAVSHAGLAGTLDKLPVGSISAVLSLVLALSHFIPVMAPYVGILQTLAGYFGAGVIAESMATKK